MKKLKKLNKLKKIIILLLVFLPIINLTTVSLDENGSGNNAIVPDTPAIISEKDEVIYARLSSGGKTENIYAVNHFVLSESGSFSDYGNYTNVVNLTNLQPISHSGGITEIKTPGDNFYYQGYLSDNDLPWVYNIEYFLDGSKIQPDELAGKSGSLEIKINSVKNNNEKISDIFYDNYMQQITVTLKIDKCNNIKANGATAANAGKNRMLVFTVMPKHDADITVTADISDFEMAGIEITAMPFSMSIEMPDIDNMTGDFDLLADAISELNDGVGKLKNGAAEMSSGADKLKDGSAGFNSGLSQLSANSKQITDGSAQIKNALSQIKDSLNEANAFDISDMFDMSELMQLPGALEQLADGLGEIQGGMTQLKDGYALAYPALDGAIASIPGYQLTEAQLFGLYLKADESEREILMQLGEIYIAAMTVKGTYEQTKAAFDAVIPALEMLSGSVGFLASTLKEMSGQISEQITETLSGIDNIDISAQIDLLSDGISQLSGNYNDFHGGLVSYMDGVTELSDAYKELDGGIAELSGGISDMSDGITELSGGTKQLSDETADMPRRVKTEIDNLISEYMAADFEIVSFTSDKNTNVSFVQFVFKANGIAKPETEKSAVSEEKQLSFWDRLVNLFGR